MAVRPRRSLIGDEVMPYNNKSDLDCRRGIRGKAVKLFCGLALASALGTSHAALVVSDLGIGAPPATLGGFAMTSFGTDGIASFTEISALASPLGGSISFNHTVSAREVGNGWSTWSHAYGGDVYFSGLLSLTITLPGETDAFYFYVEPNDFGLFDITLTAQDGSSVTQAVNGASGARGFGLHGTAGTLVSSFTVSAALGSDGFGIGEFGIASVVTINEQLPEQVPEPATLALFGIGLAAFGATRRRRA